ncbi:MAG: OmpH family outer membrane protein [Novosphingobium sp.]
MTALLLGTASVATAAPARRAAPLPPSASAPTPIAGGIVVPGLGVANLDAVIANSNAFKAAQAQRPVTYKAQYDAAEARRKQISEQLTPLVNKFQADRAAATPNAASLTAQATTIQQLNDAGSQELQKILEPVGQSEAYVQEQISDKLSPAISAAMTKARVTMLLSPQSVLAATNAYNLNASILAELNTQIPSAQLVPPAGWEPREVREQKAQAAAQQGGAAPAAPSTAQQPSGR